MGMNLDLVFVRDHFDQIEELLEEQTERKSEKMANEIIAFCEKIQKKYAIKTEE